MAHALNGKLLLDEVKIKKVEEYVPDEETLLSLSDLFSALSDRTRIKILSALSITSMCVTDLSLLLGINQTTVSPPLKNLRSLGFVQFQRQGKIIFYSIKNDKLQDILYSAVTFMTGEELVAR